MKLKYLLIFLIFISCAKDPAPSEEAVQKPKSDFTAPNVSSKKDSMNLVLKSGLPENSKETFQERITKMAIQNLSGVYRSLAQVSYTWAFFNERPIELTFYIQSGRLKDSGEQALIVLVKDEREGENVITDRYFCSILTKLSYESGVSKVISDINWSGLFHYLDWPIGRLNYDQDSVQHVGNIEEAKTISGMFLISDNIIYTKDHTRVLFSIAEYPKKIHDFGAGFLSFSKYQKEYRQVRELTRLQDRVVPSFEQIYDSCNFK